MSAPVTITAPAPSASGSDGRGERPEDGEQHERDDREAAALGDLDVLLRRLLQRRPQRALADEVQRDAVLRLAGGDRLAQVARDVGRVAVGHRGLERDDERAPGLRRRRAPAAAARSASATSATSSVARSRRRSAACRSSRRRALLGAQHRGEARARLLRELVAEPVLDGLGLRAGHAEAAAGEVVGLLRGERHRRDEREQPQRDHHHSMAAQQCVE